MPTLTIDEEKCKRDGICVEECPSRIIEIAGAKEVPRIQPGEDARCIACGHCVAVCPHGALTHARVPIENCPPIRKELSIDMAQAVQFLRARRSIRVFKDTPVEREKIQKLVEIARYAPTASNAQQVEWTILTDGDRIRELVNATVEWMRGIIAQGPQEIYSPYLIPMVNAWDTGRDRILRGAPVLVLASASDEGVYGMVDLTIALSYLELAAPGFGLGCCWAGVLHRAMALHSPLRNFAGIPDTHPHYYPMMLGYPRYKYHRLPERNRPKIHWK